MADVSTPRVSILLFRLRYLARFFHEVRLIFPNVPGGLCLSVHAGENLIGCRLGFFVSGLSGEIESVSSAWAFLFQLCSARLSIH
jgi:hypothetical protein